ncbi:MAG TPA: rhodanese-like domain-containing protein [Candidatus Binatia bacterium]|nr:rhodanese-like domain-containing protein [Candidatus Binatia bacterium]
MRTTRTGSFIVSITLILVASVATAQSGINVLQGTLLEPNQKTAEVSTEELTKILAERSALVLDARPFMEYAVSHIPGALNVSAKPGVPMSVYVSDVKEIERLVGGDKTRPLVLYCNGRYCGKSKRLSEELLGAGFTNVRRYQLGIPVWRALGGVTQIELEGVKYVHASDRTAVFLDAREPEEFSAGTLSGARNLPASGLRPGKDAGVVKKAKDDGRLPMEDHNTRIVVFGRDGAQARAVAEAVVREAFHNVTFFDGPFLTIKEATR